MPAPQLAAAAQQKLGLPDGFRTYSPFPFGGINLHDAPIAIPDTDFVYVENFLRLGDGYLRTAWDIGDSLYTGAITNPIVSFFHYNIATTAYVIVFFRSGAALQVRVSDGATTDIAGAGTFYDSTNGQLPACSQWGTLYLLISNRNTRNDYWAWDGSLLYKAGRVAPRGVNITGGGADYATAPTVTAFGGNGSGVTLVASVNAGHVVNVEITDPGHSYTIGDVVQARFTGGGSDDAAQLTAHLNSGGVAAVQITAPGSGYVAASIGFSGGGGGSGAAATAIISGGLIVGAHITAHGTGYTSAPSVLITSGTGTGATAAAILSSTGVGSVTVTHGGTGYRTAPQIDFVGGGGAGATGVVKLTPTSVAQINVNSGGSGYTSAPTVAFSSDSGTGAVATATIQNGSVIRVELTAAGSGYDAPPFITFTGGAGSGASASAVLNGTSIASVVVSNAGQLYTDAPAVVISPGANDSAYATIDLWPFGVSGSSLETFQQRVWIADPADPQFGTLPPGGNFAVSAPESLIDFATSDGGLLFTSSDSFLQTKYTGIRQSNGYLYFFGDGSIAVVSNVQTTGSPATTTFNYQNVDLQTGLSWRDSRQDFGRSMVFGNETGIYGLYGGAVTKVSSKLDKLFDAAVFPPDSAALTPSGAIATFHEIKHYLNLMTIVDPDTGLNRSLMVTWNEKEWVVTSQTVDLIYIGTQKNQSKFTAWGTDGLNLYPLFQTPSSVLVKRIDTKLYGVDTAFVVKDLFGLYMQGQDLSGDGFTINGVLSASGLAAQMANNASVPSGTYTFGQEGIDPTTMEQKILLGVPTFDAEQSAVPYWPLWGSGSGGVPFITIGARLSSTSADFSIGNLLLAYKLQQGVA